MSEQEVLTTEQIETAEETTEQIEEEPPKIKRPRGRPKKEPKPKEPKPKPEKPPRINKTQDMKAYLKQYYVEKKC